MRYHLFSRRRNPLRADRSFKDRWDNQLRQLASQRFPQKTALFLLDMHTLHDPEHKHWMVNEYRIIPSAVETFIVNDEFHVYWEGPAYQAVLCESTFLALTTKRRSDDEGLTPNNNWEARVVAFGEYIKLHKLNVILGGLRRQHTYAVAKRATEILLDIAGDSIRSITDVRLARELNHYSSGTMPHFLIMVMAALDGYVEANVSALYHWSNMFLVGQGQDATKRYGVVLPDTYTTKVGMDSLVEFYRRYPDRRGLFTGIREDSMGIEAFVPFVDTYNRIHGLGIGTIVTSNVLNDQTAYLANNVVNSAGYGCAQIIVGFVSHSLSGHGGPDIVAKFVEVWRVDALNRSGPRLPVCKLADGNKESGPPKRSQKPSKRLGFDLNRIMMCS